MRAGGSRSANQPLRAEAVRKALEGSIFGNKFWYYNSLESTHTVAKGLAEGGAPEGSVVLAEAQTAGRGRLGRRWLSPAYANLLFSVLLRPRIPADRVFVMTMLLALATVDAVKEATGLAAMIKWPNDLYVGGGKLGGILTEFSLAGRQVDYVLLGLGLNVNWNPEGAAGVLSPPTSLRAEAGRPVSRERLLVRVLRSLEGYYGRAAAGETEEIYENWNRFSLLTDERVEVDLGQERVQGRVIRIDRDGALVIEKETGGVQRIMNGDVSLRRRRRA